MIRVISAAVAMALVAAPAAVADEVLVHYRGEAVERVVTVPDGEVAGSIHELSADPDVRWAGPNPVARASDLPRDPGRSGGRPGGWVEDQWSFLAPPPVGVACSAAEPCGVNAVGAWRLLRRSGHPYGERANGRRGPIVAVVDSGVAYRSTRRRFRRSPDLAPGTFVRGYDFISNDRRPLDHNGHGTHIASTIAEQTDNRIAVTGLGDRLRIMPVRVLDSFGAGTASDVARGIRFATRNGASVINLSLEFAPRFDDCSRLRGVCRAIRAARENGVVVVAAAGNGAQEQAQMPAAVSFGVASSTIRGCLAELSSRGPGVDLTAPGGGADSEAGPHCVPGAAGPGIVQLTLTTGALDGGFERFGYPRYEGTSMAAAHVSAAAALVRAGRILHKRLGHPPRPIAIEQWLRCTARPLPPSPEAPLYGAGLLDLRAALDRRSCPELGT